MFFPKNWSLLSLNEIAADGRGTFTNGPFGSDLVKADLTDVGIPVIYIRDIRDGRYVRVSTSCITEKKAEQLSACWVKPGDVLIAKVGDPPGTAAVYPKDEPTGVVTQDVIRLRLNSEVADSQYVRNWLNSPLGKHAIKAITVEATRARFPLGDFKSLKIPLPPIAEQRRIAAILDRADAIRRKRQQAIALTEELLRSAFLEMFGDPVTNPMGWKAVTVGEIVSDVRDGPHVSPEYSDCGVPILSTRNIRPGRLVMEDVKYVSEETYLQLVKSFKPQYRDVLLTKGGTTGFAKAVDWNWSFAIWVHIAALRPTEAIRPEFLEAALNSPSCYQQSQRYTHGIANRDLGLSRIRKIQLSLPPLPLQDEYCKVRKNLLNQLANQESYWSESSNLFNSLLQRAFRGEL